MKILFMGLNQIHQGTYWRTYHLGRGLAHLGHDVTVIATSRTRRRGMRIRSENNLTMVETPDLFQGMLRSGWDPWNILNRLSYLRGRHYDLVHAFEARPTVIYPALFARKGNTPFFMDWADWHGKDGSVEERPDSAVKSIVRTADSFYEEHFRSLALGTTVICTTLRERAIRLGLPPESILLIPNGADTDNYFPQDQKMARQATGLSEGDFIVGYMGTIFPRDAAFMLDAFRKLQDQIPHARLLWIGSVPKSVLIDNSSVIQTKYLPSMEDVNRYLATCDVFWLPLLNSVANQGRFPGKLVDYMAAGRPVVATGVGDVPGVFQGGKFGFVGPVDVAAFVENTVALAKDAELRRQFGMNARERAEKNHNWLDLTKKLDGFYRRIISKANS